MNQFSYFCSRLNSNMALFLCLTCYYQGPLQVTSWVPPSSEPPRPDSRHHSEPLLPCLSLPPAGGSTPFPVQQLLDFAEFSKIREGYASCHSFPTCKDWQGSSPKRPGPKRPLWRVPPDQQPNHMCLRLPVPHSPAGPLSPNAHEW